MRELQEKTDMGKKMLELLYTGSDLPDILVIDLLRSQLQSSECYSHGYVLDSIPNLSDKALSADKQLDFLATLDPPPSYWVIISVSSPDRSCIV